MVSADNFQIPDCEESRRIALEWAEQFKRLSGYDWPPHNAAEWTVVLTRAGFPLQRIEQFLARIGTDGFDESLVGELPPGYVTAAKNEFPIFSVALIEGLERCGSTNSTPKASDNNDADGPVDGYRWRHKGEVTNTTLQPAAWKMVNHLWREANRAADFDDLKVPIYNDQEHLADQAAFGSLRRAANKFFDRYNIPWQVSIKKNVVSLTIPS